MFNKQLISICKAEGLPHAGVKAELQNRISGSKFMGIAFYSQSSDLLWLKAVQRLMPYFI
jgi:hypothetical protein